MKDLESTIIKVRLGLVFVILSSFAGGIAWVTKISIVQGSQTDTIESVERKSTADHETLQDLKSDIKVIKNDVQFIREAIKKERR